VQVLAVPELGQMLLVVTQLERLDCLMTFGHLGTLSGAEPVAGRLDPRGIRRKGGTPNFGMKPDH